jgi:hypothetical protein
MHFRHSPFAPQVVLLQQLPHTRVIVADLALLPLKQQAALAHASHVMVSTAWAVHVTCDA